MIKRLFFVAISFMPKLLLAGGACGSNGTQTTVFNPFTGKPDYVCTYASTGGGGGSSTLAVDLGGIQVSSPTAVINFSSFSFTATQSPIGQSNIGINFSSVASQSDLTKYLLSSSIYVASATAGPGVLVTGSNNVSAAAPIFSVDTSFLMTQSSASANLLSNSSATATYLQKTAIYVSSINGNASIAVTPNGTSASIVNLSQISSSSTLMGQLIGGSGITITQGSPSTTIAAQNVSSFSVSGVAAGTYGNSTNVSSITVNSQGIVIGAANVPIAFPSVSLSTMTAGATNYIFNQNTLQSGSTFYVSSGSVAGQLTIGTLQGASLTTCGDSTHGLGWSGGSFNCQTITGSGGSGGSSVVSAYGALYNSSSPTTQTGLTPTAQKLTVFTVSGISNMTTPELGSNQILVSTTGVFNVYANVISTGTGVSTETFWVAVNQSTQPISCNDTPSDRCNMEGVLNITAGSTVAVYAASTLVSGATITVQHAQLVLSTVGGSGGGGGGSTTPGGNNTDVQFNNGGAFGGNDNFEWDNANSTLTIVGRTGIGNSGTNRNILLSPSNGITINDTTGFGSANIAFQSAGLEQGDVTSFASAFELSGSSTTSNTPVARFVMSNQNDAINRYLGKHKFQDINGIKTAAEFDPLGNSTFSVPVVISTLTISNQFSGAGLSTCGDSSHALNWNGSNNQFGCQSISGGGGGSALGIATGTSSGYTGLFTGSATGIVYDSTTFNGQLIGGTSVYITVNAINISNGRVKNGNNSFTYTMQPLTAKLLSPGTTNFPKIDQSTTTGAGSLYWDSISTQTIEWTTVLAPYGGGNLNVDFNFSGSTVTSGNVAWGIYINCTGPSHATTIDNIYQGYTIQASTGGAIPSTAGIPYRFEISSLSNNGCVENDLINILMTRYHNISSDALGDIRSFAGRIYEN